MHEEANPIHKPWTAVTRIHRYADEQHEWTEQDRQALASFLRTPTGAKMERLMVC